MNALGVQRDLPEDGLWERSVTSMLPWGCSGARAGGRVWCLPVGLWVSLCCSTVGDRVASRMAPVKLVHDTETEPTSFQLNLRKDV